MAQKLTNARQDLGVILEHIGPSELNEEIRTEIRELAELLGLSQAPRGRLKPPNTKTADKVAFIRNEIEKQRGPVRKSELLELAGAWFSCRPAPTFLDTAIKTGGFKKKREREGRNVVISLPN